MANNRMMLVCNKCYPTDEDIFQNNGKPWVERLPDVVFIGKWYPIGDYVTKDNETLGELINNYLTNHAHFEDCMPDIAPEDAYTQNENPVRLTYETWVRDMPAIKKWEYKP